MRCPAVFARNLLTLHGIVVALGLGLYVMASRALHQRRHPSAAIAWVVMLTLLPYVALPLYFMFGSRKLPDARRSRRRRCRRSSASPTTSRTASLWARRLGRSMGLAPAAGYDACASTPTAARRAPRCSS